MPGQARGQSSCSSLGRFGGPCYLLDNLLPSISTAAVPCAWPTPGLHWHVLGASGWHIAAASAIPCLTARGTWTGIPRTWHRHSDRLNTLVREVPSPGRQQSHASHAALNSPARKHCSCCPLLLSNLFVLQSLFFMTTQIVVNMKASPAVGTHLRTPLRACTSHCKDLTVEVIRYFTSL